MVLWGHNRRPSTARLSQRGAWFPRCRLLSATPRWPCRFCPTCGMKRRALHRRPSKRDPIALARANWERSGWGDVADGMVAVTSVMRAHQILLARVENALRPYDLSFSRFELLRLLAFSRTGALPITQGVRPAAGARHQRHARDPAAGVRRPGRADPASDRRAHHAGPDHRARVARRSRTRP